MARVVVEHQSITHPGRVRRSNEDSHLVSSPLFVIADGMGGARAGEVASALCVEAFAGLEHSDVPPEEQLAETIREANRRIFERARDDPAASGMGTTVTAALVADGSVAFGHVGDSRAYLVREGRLQQLSDDHSLVGELMRRGALTPDEAHTHPQRSIITRALGTEQDVEPDTFTVETHDGDVFALVTDGVSGMLGDERLLEIVLRSPTLAEAAAELMRGANAAGGEDNMTAVLFRIGDGPDDALPRQSIAGLADPDPTPMHLSFDDDAPPRRALRSRVFALLGAGVVAGLLIVAGAIGLSYAHFVGATADGRLAVFQGVPLELPFGVRLYRRVEISAVPVAALSRSERATILDHRLESASAARGRIAHLPAARLLGAPAPT